MELSELMRKCVESNNGVGEGALLYYLTSQNNNIKFPPPITTDSILNESKDFDFTVKEFEVFQIEFNKK